MGAANIIRSYLVKLGYDVDETSQRKAVEGVEKLSRRMEEFAGIASITAGVVEGAITGIASKMSDLAFASARIKDSAADVQAFSFSVKQMGIDGKASLEAMASAIRTNPMLSGQLRAFGIDQSKGAVETQLELINILRRMPYQTGSAIAAQYGIDEHTFATMSQNYDFMRKMQNERLAMNKRAGVDPDKIARGSVIFMAQMNLLLERLEVMGIGAAGALLPVATKLLILVNKFLDGVMWLDKAMGHTLTITLALVSALKGVGMGMSLLRGVGGLLGGGAGVAGGGAAAAAGGLGAIPVVGGIVTATLAGVQAGKALNKHIEQNPNGFLAKSFDMKFAYNAYRRLTGQETDSDIARSTKEMVAKGGKVAPQIDMITKLLVHFEGWRNKVYKDQAGFSTIGVGHKLLSGENFTNISDDMVGKLLQSDIAKKMEAIGKIVKRQLNKNQMAALLDFVFNVGEGGLKGKNGATGVLRAIESGGDVAGALAKWDKMTVNGKLVRNDTLAARRAAEGALYGKAVVNQDVDIHVSGAGDPVQVAKEVGRQQANVLGAAQRSMQGTIN